MNEFVSKTITTAGRRTSKFMRPISRVFGGSVLVFFLSACVGGVRSLAPDDMVAVSIGAVGHYGSMIGIPEFTVNGHWGGNNSGWGGGGGGVCCVLLPMKATEPVMVTVKWQSCDISGIDFRNNKKVDPNARCKTEEHEQTVRVHFSVPPGESGSFTIHFMPGHTVEAWVTKEYPEGSHYPGPPYPRGPAPRYVPLRGESPQQSLAEETK